MKYTYTNLIGIYLFLMINIDLKYINLSYASNQYEFSVMNFCVPKNSLCDEW